MKKNSNPLALLITFTLFFMGMLSAVVHVKAQSQSQTQQTQHQSKSEASPDIKIGVDGMSCPFCAFGIEKKISKLEAVESLNVMLEKGFVEIFLKNNQPLAEPELRKAVKKAGFTVRSVEYLNKQAKPDQSG